MTVSTGAVATAAPGALRVEQAVRAANEQDRAALIVYVPAGYPDVERSVECLRAAAEAGADVLEIGFPYSDPLLDGPTIQAANQVALDAGYTPVHDLEVAREVCGSVDVPALLMTYYNLVWHYAAADRSEAFAADAASAGLAGAIIPDLPSAEGGEWAEVAAAHGLASVFLAAPSSGDERLRNTAALSTGFVYATSTLGVTGERGSVSLLAEPLVRRLRKLTPKPVCVGIGVSTGQHAAEVARFADGVIVGSATTRAAGEGGAAAVAELVAELAAGCRR